MVTPEVGRYVVVIPDGLGTKRPQAITVTLPYGTDTRWLFAVVHSDGSPYDLTACTLKFAFKKKLTDADPLFSRQVDVTSTIDGHCQMDTNDSTILKPGGFVTDGIFTDSSGETARTDEGVLVSRVEVTATVGTIDDEVTPFDSVPAIAQGTPGIPTSFSVWDSGREYGENEIVAFTSHGATSMYVSIAPSLNHEPTDPDYWVLAVSGNPPAGTIVRTIGSDGVIGDTVVFQTDGFISEGPGYFTLADIGSYTQDATIVVGWLLEDVVAGQLALVAVGGGVSLAPEVTGLNGSNAGRVTVDLGEDIGRLRSALSTETAFGYCDLNGYVQTLVAGFTP